MFKIESYVTPILLSYVDKYVRDFKPADAQVSLWGGGVALHNLVLKADVLQQEVALPFTLVSGRIHELLIQVPWTKIMSEPIVVTIDTIECILSLNKPDTGPNEENVPDSPSRKAQVVEAPPGYMQALVRRIVSNIALRIHHLIVKYVQDDIVMSLNVKHVAVDSAGVHWEPAFADIDQSQPVIRRLMRLDDLTLCLDKADADGKIRFYQQPLLYRCQLDFRILTRLVSANTRRASSVSIQLRSSKLAWGVTGDQITMLIRLVRERSLVTKTPAAATAKSTDTQAAAAQAQSANSAEPARSESWSDWAWSWLPALADREHGVQDAPAPHTPVPLHFAAYFDELSFVFRLTDTDSANRKRTRSILELIATHTVFKSYVCNPTTVRMRAGTRSFHLQATGKCVCGRMGYHAYLEEPTYFIQKKEQEEHEKDWTWPDDDFTQIVETTQPVIDNTSSHEQVHQAVSSPTVEKSDTGQPEEPTSTQKVQEPQDEGIEFWKKMAPQFFLEFIHERSPPQIDANPYENPPTNFEYSDWVEECVIKAQLEPEKISLSMGLIHRLTALCAVFKELPPMPRPTEPPLRTLTVEECEALINNMPQRRINIEVSGLEIRLRPWDHALREQPEIPPLVLNLELPKIHLVLNAPLYPHRVCMAACQMPDDIGPLWQAARLHATLTISSFQVKICSDDNSVMKPCARADFKAVMHFLLNKEYFAKRENVQFACSLKINEAHICGSAARLRAAYQVPLSLYKKQHSVQLRCTSLPSDALNDEESAVIDLTLEDLLYRNFFTKNTTTHILSVQTAKATALHEPKGSALKQAWLISAPDSHTNTPCLRLAVQYCKVIGPETLEYAGIWTEPAAVVVDPLFIAWLAYRPTLKQFDPITQVGSMKSFSSLYFNRRRTTPTSSSGRGASKTMSGAEVHVRGRSTGSSERGVNAIRKPDPKVQSPLEKLLGSDRLLALYQRLQKMLVNVEIGLTLVYVTMTTASAVDCVTIRDAMERHASNSQYVVTLSLGRLTMFSSTVTRQVWNEIRHDGPTFTMKSMKSQVLESFPWKILLADVSIYTLQVPSLLGKEKGLRSQLRIVSVAQPRTVMELVTSVLTVTVVTKKKQIKQYLKREPNKKAREMSAEEARTTFFTTGVDFKPSTLTEFVRGPSKRMREKSQAQELPEKAPSPEEEFTIKIGPVVSLGIHLHADTPPLVFRLEHSQVPMIASTLHCFTHIQALLTRAPLFIPPTGSQISLGATQSLLHQTEPADRSASTTTSEERSELIPIFEAQSVKDWSSSEVKTSLWFQWVVSRITIVATSDQTKLVLNVDDIISSVDLQAYYNQFKVKVASASVKHFTKTGHDEWSPGALGGRVLEAREPTDAKEDNHFIGITITQAQVSNLPASWKEELHPKLLERKRSTDCMWEVYATLAPLEAVIQPRILNQMISLCLEMAPRSFCPLSKEKDITPKQIQWPFCYVNAGGLRLLLTIQDEESDHKEDDTFMFMIGKITVNPYPENPICRRPINPTTDSGWLSNSGGLDGQQYELMIERLAILCAQFNQLVNHEISEQDLTKGTARENPARKWNQQVVQPNITPVLHSLNVGCILAPVLYVNNMLTCGPAIEVNIESDCSLEISVDQVVLAQKVIKCIEMAFEERGISNLNRLEDDEHVCPYAVLLMSPDDSIDDYDSAVIGQDTGKSSSDIYHGADSGVDFGSKSGEIGERGASLVKKSVSIGFSERWGDASEFLEVFITMGIIELSLYAVDDGSPEICALRPPPTWKKQKHSDPVVEQHILVKTEEQHTTPDDDSHRGPSTAHSTKSITDTARKVDVGKMELEYASVRKGDGNVPLLSMTLTQPNIYYWRRMSQKTIQVSIFDAWVGFGAGLTSDYWYATILSTKKGSPDPVTCIPPALATLKVVVPAAATLGSSAISGSIRLDIERPVMLEVSEDHLRMFNGLYDLAKVTLLPLMKRAAPLDGRRGSLNDGPPLYRLKQILVRESIESVTVQTTQMGLSGSEGAAGWDALSVQIGASARPERLVARALVSAAVVSAGPPTDSRHVVIQPVMMGSILEATWEAWRRMEGGMSACEPIMRLAFDLDRMEIDLRPQDLAAFRQLQGVLEHFTTKHMTKNKDNASSTSSSSENTVSTLQSDPRHEKKLSSTSIESSMDEHFYKDDLRSGAFKIVSGGQLPMAYQVTLHNHAVSWRYPHPRAITRLVIFPLPGQDEETPCVLELFSPMLCQWDFHSYFSVPVGEPRELLLNAPSLESVSAQVWRFRVLESEGKPLPFEFNLKKYMPREDPLAYETCEDIPLPAPSCGVTAEQLSGVVRVDSCFSPRLAPRLRLVARIAHFALYLHNSPPQFSSLSPCLEGYYVSKPLWRSHRVLGACARSATLRGQLLSPAGSLLLLHTYVSSDVLDCATGAMDRLIEEFRFSCGVSAPTGSLSRARLALTHVRCSLHLPRLRTLQTLAADWHQAVIKHVHQKSEVPLDTASDTSEQDYSTAEELEGLVSLWVHNSTASALRIGQEGTEEVVPIGSGAKLAYRWRSTTAPKRLRFALVGTTTDWSWSASIPFTIDHFRLRLNDSEALGSCKPLQTGGAYLYTSVEEEGSRLHMRLSGRLCLANMLRFHLLYKVRARCNETNQWHTVASGELNSESVGRTVICGAICEMTVKIKFTSNDTGWSGDIPLKECPKENVPWLVKVPCEGDLPYISVWTRVVRSRTDGRVTATVWPLYVLYSYLSLDTDVLIVTECCADTETPLPPLVQAAPGRGSSTHLLAPGTTAARHSLSFQYRNIECPVTKEAVPLHYGMPPTSVFDKRSPSTTLEDVYTDTMRWLERSGRFAVSEWPYSVVAKHWPGKWKPALLQPRCDVSVQYRAVRVGGGCSLEIQLRPVVILCNAAPIPLTLRAHDAAPLCKLESGTAISPPSAVLTKPFFISVEIGRETFVSNELSVTRDELGVYGAPQPGRIALGMHTEIAIHCHHKVALLTMHYEVKEEINVLGLTSTYMLINRMNTDILMTALAVPNEEEDLAALKPTSYKTIEPTEPDSTYGTSVCKFWVSGRMWFGSDPAELRLFLCLAMPRVRKQNPRACPVRLGQPPLRRPVALLDERGASVPAVVTQVKQEGRWVVTVAPDPCPQFLVYNKTKGDIGIAQPVASTDEPSTSKTTIRTECQGTSWHCVIPPDSATFYSTPSYSFRYPPRVEVAPQPTVTFLTFARILEMSELEWCAPVAAADGEQLLQLRDTVKMRLRTHPHSTHIELRDVDENDISASDIRKRLIGAFSSDDVLGPMIVTNSGANIEGLKRTDADEQLLLPAAGSALTSGSVEVQSTTEHTETGNDVTQSTESGGKTRTGDTSTVVLFSTARNSIVIDQASKAFLQMDSGDSGEEASNVLQSVSDTEWDETGRWRVCDRVRLVAASVALQIAAFAHVRPLIALHLDRAAVVVKSDSRKTKTTISIADVQIDNLQYESGQYDFAVVATTRAKSQPDVAWPPLWTMFAEQAVFASRDKDARALLRFTHVAWTAEHATYTELTEVEIRVGPLALFVEDAYVTALVSLTRKAERRHATPFDALLAEERALRAPLRLRQLHLHPLDLTLTLHTAVRMYIALDQSPLRLSAFKLNDMMTSTERLTHALTVHYLSAAILGAGWVVGGLELLGAPGALAARVGGATGGVRGLASATAAALLRSLSAWAGSLARNLDLLAGDEEHAQRAAAARRRPPQNFMAGLAAGITNFAINILGAVGGLAHHPVVGVAVGESGSGATALRRSLIGAFAKPLSATADLVAYAGQGLLTQTGWDPVPQPRTSWNSPDSADSGGWRRDCVRWTFRLNEVPPALAGYHVLLDGVPIMLLFTHKFLVLAQPDTDRIVEMIDFKFCTIGPYQGQVIELVVTNKRPMKLFEARLNEVEDHVQLSAAAMARVARYTGMDQSGAASAAGGAGNEARVLSILPTPGQALALHAALAASAHHNSDAYIPLL